MEPILVHVSNALERDLSKTEMEQLQKELSEKINDLLLHDFARLIQLLYRIDIDEKKLKASLHNRKEEAAGMVIADMMIKRISHTIATRKEFWESHQEDIDEELKW